MLPTFLVCGVLKNLSWHLQPDPENPTSNWQAPTPSSINPCPDADREMNIQGGFWQTKWVYTESTDVRSLVPVQPQVLLPTNIHVKQH